MAEIENRLGTLRRERGCSAVQLAKMVNVSRQTIYAIEAGTYVPNTAVALRLARALQADVNDLFSLAEEHFATAAKTEEALLLPGGEVPVGGQAVQLCRVDAKLVACVPAATPCYFPPSDGVVTDKVARPGRTRVQLFHSDLEFRNKILIAGCDPGISVLARHAHATGTELVLAHCNSSHALRLLKEGSVHIAGTHLLDEASGESNIPEIGRRFARNAVAVVSFAVWEEGIVTARGNPKNIEAVGDLARPDVLLINREEGSGSRLLLDDRLKALSLDPRSVRGYGEMAGGHLQAAWGVRTGAADCCVATRAAARLFGLGFVPLVVERYDLAMRREHLDLPSVQLLLNTLNRLPFRQELEGLGGYDTRLAGRRLL